MNWTSPVGFFRNRLLLIGAMALILTACAGGDDGPMPPSNAGFSISGTIQASQSALIDSDVNDPFADYTPNDTINDPQPIPNPATVGGYVNVAGTGDPGRSRSSGDPNDYFRVSLADGQTITLFIADHATADLDLFLYDITGNLVASSTGADNPESVTAGAADTYFIRVFAFSGASNYNLTVGQSATAAGTGGMTLSAEFVPWEVIVRFKEDHAALRHITTADGMAASLGMQHRAGGANREMLMAIDSETDRRQAFDILGVDPTVRKRSGERVTDARTQRKLDTLALVRALRGRPEVRSADLNYIRRPTAVPNDANYARQWHYPLINLPQAWDLTTGDTGVIVAVIDTGVLRAHPDLAGRLTNTGYDFIRSTAISLDGDGIDNDPDDPGDEATGGSSFHGTHVAGTIAATTNNSAGVAGVTWNTQIMPLRALGRGGGTSYDVLQCVRYAAGLTNDSGGVPAQIADIMNLSLGGGGFSQTEQDVFTQARNRGVIIVAAAGNSASSAPSYPAAYAGVISVSAVDYNKNLAWYSNFGGSVDVAAPGGNTGADANLDGLPDGVLSTCGDDSGSGVAFTYCFYQGTSMASPHVAGVAALMKAQNDLMTPDEFDAFLLSGDITEDLGPAGRDDSFGYGLIDALKAVGAAAGSVPAILRVNPASVSFAPTASAKTLALENVGTSDEIIVSSVTSNVSWLTVAPPAPPSIPLLPGSTQILDLSVDRSDPGLSSDGIYDAQVVIDYNDPNNNKFLILTVPVSVQVGTSFVGGNAGYHYVILVDPETLFTRAQVEVDYNPTTGVYRYGFSGVPAGTYLILAGTDSDNDFFIGDPGEAFGAYLTVDQPASLNVAGNLSGIDFVTGFDFNVSSGLGAADGSDTGTFYMRMDRTGIGRQR